MSTVYIFAIAFEFNKNLLNNKSHKDVNWHAINTINATQQAQKSLKNIIEWVYMEVIIFKGSGTTSKDSFALVLS